MAEIAESCRAFDEDLSALIDDELVAERRAEVLAHVAACPGCSARLESLRAVDRALADLPAPTVAPDLRARLARRIEGERGAHRVPPPLRRSRRLVPLLGLPAAAAAALALYFAVRTPRPSGTPVEPVPIAKAAPAAPSPQPQIAKAEPVAPPVHAEPQPGTPAERAPQAPAEGELEALDTEDLAVVLDLDTIEDLPVIANLEVLERLLQAEAG